MGFIDMTKKFNAFIVSLRPEEAPLAPQPLVDHPNMPVLLKHLLPSDMARATSSVESWLGKVDKEDQVLRLLHNNQTSKAHHIRCPNLDLVFKGPLRLRRPNSRVEAIHRAQHRMATHLSLLHLPPLLALAKARV